MVSVLPEVLKHGHHLRTIVVSSDGTCAGQHLQTSLKQADHRDQATSQITPGHDLQANASTTLHDPPGNECVKAFFHLDTQTPNIELVACKLDENTGTETTFSCRLFAEDIDWDTEERVAFTVAKYVPIASMGHTESGHEQKSAGKQLLEKYSQSFQKTCVIRVSITLTMVAERCWEGMKSADLAKSRAHPDPDNECDNLITCLEKNDRIDLFFDCKSGGQHVNRWENKFATYMHDLFTVVKRHKHFWFYRWQCEEDGQEAGGDAIFNSVLPDIAWVVPRWLVKEWIFTKTISSNGVVRLSNPKPYDWSPLKFPTSGYNSMHEAAFTMEISEILELSNQSADLLELVHGGDEYQSINKKERGYAMHVFPDLESDMADKGIVMRKSDDQFHVCHRMIQALIAWSSKWCYDGLVKSDPQTGCADMPLLNMLHHYWKCRLGEAYNGSCVQIGLDATSHGVQDENEPGTTSRANRVEADIIALTIIEMIILDPPSVYTRPFRRIRGEDICVIANYTEQILEIRRAVARYAEEVDISSEDLRGILYKTTPRLKGVVRKVTFYSTTIASGAVRLPMDESLPLRPVADINNLNMCLTRCQVARYIVGAHQLFLQAKKDRHPLSKIPRNFGFFDLIADLHNRASIVSYVDTDRWFTEGQQPEHANTFTLKLAEAAVLDGNRPITEPEDGRKKKKSGRKKRHRAGKKLKAKAKVEVEVKDEDKGDEELDNGRWGSGFDRDGAWVG